MAFIEKERDLINPVAAFFSFKGFEPLNEKKAHLFIHLQLQKDRPRDYNCKPFILFKEHAVSCFENVKFPKDLNQDL